MAAPSGPKRLVLLFDGTWNEVSDRTNITRLNELLAERAGDGRPIRPRRFDGVGVKWHEKFGGGVFGRYLSSKVLEGYEHLVDQYQPGDEVFIFGFSRGAFAALMLVGFCYWCGLRKPAADLPVQQLFDRYRDATLGDNEAGKEGILAREQLLGRELRGEPLTQASRALLEATLEMPIKFVGVFDTVRSAGLEPLYPRAWRGVGPETVVTKRGTLVCRYTRHLPRTVESAYQALAIDEHRAAFAERVWIVPKDKCVPQHAEQRWFAGAHANVGGGYEGDDLHLFPLRWMQEKATGAGLAFKALAVPPTDPKAEQIRDSYREFGGGLYRLFDERYDRAIEAKEVGRNRDVPDVSVRRINETIDESVLRMILRDGSNYAPGHLKASLDAIASSSGGDDGRLAREAMERLIAR